MGFSQTIHGAGHMMMLERALPVNTLLHEFFAWEPASDPLPKKESTTRPEAAKARLESDPLTSAAGMKRGWLKLMLNAGSPFFRLSQPTAGKMELCLDVEGEADASEGGAETLMCSDEDEGKSSSSSSIKSQHLIDNRLVFVPKFYFYFSCIIFNRNC